MKKMKKMIIFLLFMAGIILLTSNTVNASSSDLFLNHLDFVAQINEDGSMDVTEKWNIKINETNTLYKTFEIDKTKYSNITNVTVTDITSSKNQLLTKSKEWKYHLPKGTYFGGLNEDGLFEIAWGVGLDNSSARRSYTISYKVEDAISKYSDYAELYWQFVGEDFEIDAENITGAILLPDYANSTDNIKVWGHTEDLNGEIYATDTNKIEFNIDDFQAGRYVEIRTLFPTEMITYASRVENTPRLEEVINEETQWANEANARREMKKMVKRVIAIIVNIIFVILIILGIKSIIKNIRKIKESKKLKPSQEPQYYREMPREDSTPAEALSLYYQKAGEFNNSNHIGRIFSATLLDLSLKKIIDFEENGKIIKIKILKKITEELENSKDEKIIYEFLKDACKNNQYEITTKELEKYIKKEQTKVIKLKENIDKNTEEALYQKELADKKGKEEHTKISNHIAVYSAILFFLIIAVVFLIVLIGPSVLIGIITYMIVVIIQLIVLSILLKRTNILTQKGMDEYAKWKGLKKYMEDFSMLDRREIPEIVIWENFLVYATVFGIADKVLKQLKAVYPNINEELDINTYSYMHLMMNTNFSNSFSSAISSSMSSAYSSATGGGGGFSGGGRRPDGGRRRRRRKITPPLLKQKIGKEKNMEQDKTDKLYELINNIPVTEQNIEIIKEIKKDLARKRLYICFKKNRNFRKKKRKKST